MPSLSLTKTAANGLAHDASHVNTPLTEVETWANTTKIDYLNVQDNGLRTSSLRTHAQVDAVRIKVRNATGSTIAANSLIYFNGTYSDGTNNYPTIAQAVSATSVGSTFFAQAVTTGAIANGADGTAAIFYELTGQNTSSGTVGDSVYLDTTAGGWTRTRPTGGQYVQVVGTITVVNASSGRVVLSLGSVPEHLTGGSSGLGATFQTLTVQGASGGAADIYHISDAGEDNADKWKISVADGGNMTWENYTSGSYAAKLTMTSAGAVTTAGALNIGSVSAAGEDTDKFLVLDSSSNVDYRTGAQVLSDIGAQASGTYTTLAFKTIAVSGQSDVVADAADDTLTLAAGTGITLTTNAGSDTVTITGTAATVTALNNATADELVTVGSTTTELDAEADLTFASNKLTIFGTTGTGTTPPAVLNLSTRETTVVDNDQLGRIDFQAPAETGTDAVKVGASLWAEAEATFAADNNSTALVFATNTSDTATERMRLQSDGKLHLSSGSASIPQLELGLSGSIDGLVVARESMYFNIDSYGESTSKFFQIGHNSQSASGATALFKVDESGDATISDGDLVIGTAGHGIDFSATSDGAGTDSSELLDDYEEGTFTPTLGAHSSDGTHSYTTQVGNYTKVGNVVHIWMQMTINTLNTSGTISGNLEISGLPYTSANTTGQAYMGTFLPVGLDMDSGTGPVAHVSPNATKISLIASVDNASYDTFTSADVASGDGFWIQFSYPV